MQQSRVGSFSVSQIMDLLHVSKVTAYEISKLPQLKRRLVGKRYRILKADFWDWYNSQSTYQAYEEDFNFEEFFTSADIAEMFGWETNSVYKFIIKNNLKSDLCRTQFLVKKDSFIDWYIHQFRYTSDDPRLPPKVVTPTYDIHQVKKILESQRTAPSITYTIRIISTCLEWKTGPWWKRNLLTNGLISRTDTLQ